MSSYRPMLPTQSERWLADAEYVSVQQSEQVSNSSKCSCGLHQTRTNYQSQPCQAIQPVSQYSVKKECLRETRYPWLHYRVHSKFNYLLSYFTKQSTADIADVSLHTKYQHVVDSDSTEHPLVLLGQSRSPSDG